MPLTDLQVRKEKPSDKPRKLADGGGLYLLVNQAGKYWRWKYRFEGKEKVMALGVYPDVSLAEAREAHQTARKLLASGADPMAERKQQAFAPAGTTFMQVARQWWDHWSPSRSARHADYVLRRMETDIFPVLGQRPISEIQAPELVRMTKTIEGVARWILLSVPCRPVVRSFATRSLTVWLLATRQPKSGQVTFLFRAGSRITHVWMPRSCLCCCGISRSTRVVA